MGSKFDGYTAISASLVQVNNKELDNLLTQGDGSEA